MSDKKINLTLNIWRQESVNTKGKFEVFKVSVSPDASILEMFDELNNNLEKEGKIPIAFESDCREGICGTCGFVINGRPHGNIKHTATCQLHMRNFNDGETIFIEPFRAKAFQVIKELVVDRSGFDIIQCAHNQRFQNIIGIFFRYIRCFQQHQCKVLQCHQIIGCHHSRSMIQGFCRCRNGKGIGL